MLTTSAKRWPCCSRRARRHAMDLLRDDNIDPAPLLGKRVAILGYGNQGRAQALNLRDSGIDVVVGLRGGSGSLVEVESAGLTAALLEDAVATADVVMFLHRDDSDQEKKSDTELIVSKHRNGPTGSIKLYFDLALTQFRNAVRAERA